MQDTDPKITPPSEEARSTGEIKFSVKTLKSDLEEKSGEESSFNLNRESIPTQKVKLPEEKIIIPTLKPAPPPPEIKPQPDNSFQFTQKSTPIITPVEFNPPADEQRSALQSKIKKTYQFETPIKTSPELSEGALEQKETIGNAEFFDEIEEKKRSSFLSNPIIIILIGIVVISLLGFFVYGQIQKRQTPDDPVIKLQENDFPVAPIFTPPQSKTISTTTATTTTPMPTTTAVLIIPPTTTSTNAIITQKPTTKPVTKTATPIEKIEVGTEPKSPKIFEPIQGTQKEIQPTKTISNGEKSEIWMLGLSALNIPVIEFNNERFKTAWLNSFKYQKKAGELWSVNFTNNNKNLNGDFIIDYFINPTFIESKYVENFKKSIGTNYEIIYYYTHTRKFPILIFEIKDELTAVPFIKLWDKETLISDFKNIYYGISTGKFTRNYLVTQAYKNIDYRIAFKDDDYKLIWTIYNGKLIISSSISGFQILIDRLKNIE